MKKIFSISGMCVCLAIVLLGVLTLCCVLEPDLYRGSWPSPEYDYGYASFGSDYYTMSNNNMAMAAYNAAYATSNIADLGFSLQILFGILLISIGLVGICGFGIVFAGCEKKPSPALEAPVEENVAEEVQE